MTDKPKPIKDRIITALRKDGNFGLMQYYDLALEVFPKDQYPNAWNYPTRGGPPGCYMVLRRAIREPTCSMSPDKRMPGVVYSTVGLGKNR